MPEGVLRVQNEIRERIDPGSPDVLRDGSLDEIPTGNKIGPRCNAAAPPLIGVKQKDGAND
jgi:hypothetical protein